MSNGLFVLDDKSAQGFGIALDVGFAGKDVKVIQLHADYKAVVGEPYETSGQKLDNVFSIGAQTQAYDLTG